MAAEAEDGEGGPDDPTIVSIYEEIEYKSVKFSIWDLGGQTRHRPLWKYHYQGTKGILFMVDSSDKQRMHEARAELHDLLKAEQLQSAALMVLANKQDVPGGMSAGEVSDLLGLSKACGPRPWFVQPCSALCGEGMHEAMDWVLGRVR
eukprot:CAMPEP_0174930562 /NCGR_PEP_ID=MMETSP1355-20121228/31230_1 /TAXON_ID=464990 /ORGANISM="Hemiselmis tepida, Strain CCMP443" /LENGTH=147 /DNA_ID=CAMNT_0016176867 /DNA_START=177 /DNA_END=618 /DNA_ORIENTATION=-